MPGLRKNLMERLTHELVIDKEFEALIPPLTPDEFTGLEASILEEGCRDAIIVWGNIIIDGHNRYKICTTHNIPYRTEGRDFSSRQEAMLWMLQNQLSRRNLNDFQRIEIVRMYEDVIKANAKGRQGTRNDLLTSEKIFTKVKRANDELGTMSGVSGKTYEHAAAVLDRASEPILEAVRNGELSIDAAYGVINLPQEAQDEITTRISDGEKPRDVVSKVKKQHKKYSMKYWNAMLKNAEQAVNEAPNLDTVISLVSEALKFLKEAKRKKNN